MPKGRFFTGCSGTKVAVMPKGRSFTGSSGTKIAVLPKGRSSTANSGTKFAVLLGMNRCSSFPLLSAPHSSLPFERTLKDLKRYQGSHRGGEESGFGYLGPLAAKCQSVSRRTANVWQRLHGSALYIYTHTGCPAYTFNITNFYNFRCIIFRSKIL